MEDDRCGDPDCLGIHEACTCDEPECAAEVCYQW